MTDTPNAFVHQIAAGIADRLRLLVRSIDRLDRLESGTGQWLGRFEEEELDEAAQELTLRALRVASSPTHLAVLRTLARAESLALSQIMEATGLGRLALTEHINDLIQVGLATRNIDTDHAQITPAGQALAAWVDELIEAVAQGYRAAGA